MYALLQVGGQLFSAHKFILNSQTCDFSSQLVVSDSPSCPPELTFKLRKKCDNPDVFDAFLHYVYGSSIRLVPLAKPHFLGNSGASTESTNSLLDGIDSTPDTSLVSLDEDDLTEEYDKFGVSNEHGENWLDGDELLVCMLL